MQLADPGKTQLGPGTFSAYNNPFGLTVYGSKTKLNHDIHIAGKVISSLQCDDK